MGLIEASAQTSLFECLGTDILVDDDVTISVRTEALQYYRWLYWHHGSSLEQLAIMMVQMGLTF